MRRALGGLVGTSVFVLVALAGAAFACTASAPAIYSIRPESATPGSTVVVQGTAVRSDAPVELRWNGARGELLAVATPSRGAFSVPVKLPAVAPGVYALSAVTADGSVGRTAIEVTAVPGAAPVAPAPLWSGGAERGAPAVAGGGLNPAGMVLLAVGLIGLFAGATVAVARRRRVPALLEK